MKYFDRFFPFSTKSWRAVGCFEVIALLLVPSCVYITFSQYLGPAESADSFNGYAGLRKTMTVICKLCNTAMYEPPEKGKLSGY